MTTRTLSRIALCTGVALLLSAAATAWGQGPAGEAPPTGGPAAAPGAAADDKPAFKPEELDQMLAPIALYPDSLLSQIFMATTYPLEIVEADRWAKAHTDLTGAAAAKALEDQRWDPSVKSLVNFPDVLSMLSDKLDWTQRMGDAFLGQPKDVMATVQKLRAKAKEQGQLESTKEQTVTVEKDGNSQAIVIESTNPEVIYVPSYNPTVVYGSWPYPAYPPYPYYPPGYVASGALAFGTGVVCGLAWGYAAGNCNWGHGDVDIDVNRNTNFNQNIDRSKFKNSTRNGSFQHDPSRRGGVGYRNSSTAQKYGGATAARNAQTRDAYRGRAEQGRSDLARSGNSITAPGRTAAPNRSSAGTGQRSGGALDGVNDGGARTRQQSDRGWDSRASSASRGSSANRSSGGGRVGGSGGSRGSGASRGGGGGRGGGGRR